MRKFLATIAIAAASLTACQPATTGTIATATTTATTTANVTVKIGDYGHGQPLDSEIDQCENAGGMMVDATYPTTPPAGPITWYCAEYAA